MRKLAPAVALLMLFASCRRHELPMEPVGLVSADAQAPAEGRRRAVRHREWDYRFALNPTPLVLQPGESGTIEVKTVWEYPLGVAFGCVGPCDVAEVTGSIPTYSDRGTIIVKALRPGRQTIGATIWNFGRAPGSATVGEVVVVAPNAGLQSLPH